MSKFTDIGVEKAGHVGLIEIRRPPLNFFDVSLINQIADALEEFDNDIEIRASVLAAQGKAFCAGANFGDPARQEQEERRPRAIRPTSLPINHLYVQAVRIFRNKKPIVAAVHGAAIGGGLGLAVSADFRVTCPEARFSANFTKLGFHPGFGLTATLPELVGKNNAELIFYTSRRVTGEEATRMGLANVCVPQDQVRAEAMKLAQISKSMTQLSTNQNKTLYKGANFSDPARQAQEEPGQASKGDPADSLGSINSLYRARRTHLPRQKADRRRRAGRGHRRRPRACGIGRFPRHLPRSALRRELHQARLSSRASA